MRTHLRELLTLRSSWILLLFALASKILSGVGTFLGEKAGSPIFPNLVAGDDMAPFFFGIFAAIAISGYFSHGTMTYDLLANPRRWKIQVSRIASSASCLSPQPSSQAWQTMGWSKSSISP